MGATVNSNGSTLTGYAAGASVGGTALTGFGRLDQGLTGAQQDIQAGTQQAEMDEFTAQREADAAAYGRTQASQTDTAMRQATAAHIGNMMATFASANTGSASPTNAAILMRTQGVGDQERGIQVGNLEAQAQEAQQESGFYTTAAQQTLQDAYANANSSILGGVLGIGGTLLSGLSGLKFT